MNLSVVGAQPVKAAETGVQQIDPKLRKAAQDFEAILLGAWLKEVEESFSSPDESAGADNFRSLGVEAVAEALAARGGIGVAAMVLRQLGKAPEGATETAKDVP